MIVRKYVKFIELEDDIFCKSKDVSFLGNDKLFPNKKINQAYLTKISS